MRLVPVPRKWYGEAIHDLRHHVLYTGSHHLRAEHDLLYDHLLHPNVEGVLCSFAESRSGRRPRHAHALAQGRVVDDTDAHGPVMLDGSTVGEDFDLVAPGLPRRRKARLDARRAGRAFKPRQVVVHVVDAGKEQGLVYQRICALVGAGTVHTRVKVGLVQCVVLATVDVGALALGSDILHRARVLP